MHFYGRIKELSFKPEKPMDWLQFLELNDGEKVMVDVTRETKVRTPQQNSALHLYYTHLAKELNEKGLTCRYILGTKEVQLDWTVELIKEMIWRPIQIALTGKKSTTSLDKVSEIDVVYEHLNRFFSNEPFCIHVPFPSEENKPKIENYPHRTDETTPTI